MQASAPLSGGALAHPDLAAPAHLLRPGLTVAQACLLAVAVCPGVSRLLVSASTRAHGEAAVSALDRDPVPASVLREVLEVLAPDWPSRRTAAHGRAAGSRTGMGR
ncbi:hypothetical protein GCM10010329_62710 [Streptomyces spiroverticillatus]|nr:hypothetical protein GCM10010329_62710 [Streptomyces spiroverticillatus]